MRPIPAVIGADGLKPDTPYKLADGEFVEAAAEGGAA
jgi:hypothetical protein